MAVLCNYIRTVSIMNDNNMKHVPTYLTTYLTYAGAVPFVMCAFCFLMEVRFIPIVGNVAEILGIYSLVIASFMAGSHWGQHVHLSAKWAFYLQVSSNINAVFIWLAYLLLSFEMLLIVLASSFLVLLLIDRKMFYHHLMTQAYFRTRCIVTLIVETTLIIAGIYA